MHAAGWGEGAEKHRCLGMRVNAAEKQRRGRHVASCCRGRRKWLVDGWGENASFRRRPLITQLRDSKERMGQFNSSRRRGDMNRLGVHMRGLVAEQSHTQEGHRQGRREADTQGRKQAHTPGRKELHRQEHTQGPGRRHERQDRLTSFGPSRAPRRREGGGTPAHCCDVQLESLVGPPSHSRIVWHS